MDKIYIGKIVSTHGIKGEIRIISDFQYKEKIFSANNKIIIDNQEYIIKTYRKHKNYDMVTLEGYNDINDVLFMLKKKVYFYKKDLNLSDDEVLDDDLLTYKVCTSDNLDGKVEEIFFASQTNKIIRVSINKRSVLIPYNSPMVKKISKSDKIIYIELIEGML